jgi:hypothetical protein
MHTRLFLALACLLVIVRLPSLVQPMGADQGLYAYVGERILDGGLPYRDAWDQKPPTIHFAYAVLRGIIPMDGAAAAADLVLAVLTAGLLFALALSLAGAAAARVATLLFLFLSDPGFQRLAGVSVRAQCETFIAAAITGAFLLVARGRNPSAAALGAGVLLGTAAAFKYNAAVYGAALLAAMWVLKRLTWQALAWLIAGSLFVPVVLLTVFIAGGALEDLLAATIGYNLLYSGETYSGALHFVRYLVTFPVQHARVDALWLLGGVGCVALLFTARTRREHVIAPVWVGAACLTIAVNGSRGLPQYFVQALPALALAAAWAGTQLWTTRRMVNGIVIVLLAIAVWRVNEFSNLADNFVHDGRYVLGQTTREDHLGRYGDREERKYSALAMAELADFVRARTSPSDDIYIFGFASGAYVQADRRSSSRFFWSRPVIVDFNAEEPGYGVAGLRADLEARPPAIVALQLRDWSPDVTNSAEFFMSTPTLADWLRTHYEPVAGPAGFDIWTRRLTTR